MSLEESLESWSFLLLTYLKNHSSNKGQLYRRTRCNAGCPHRYLARTLGPKIRINTLMTVNFSCFRVEISWAVNRPAGTRDEGDFSRAETVRSVTDATQEGLGRAQNRTITALVFGLVKGLVGEFQK